MWRSAGGGWCAFAGGGFSDYTHHRAKGSAKILPRAFALYQRSCHTNGSPHGRSTEFSIFPRYQPRYCSAWPRVTGAESVTSGRTRGAFSPVFFTRLSTPTPPANLIKPGCCCLLCLYYYSGAWRKRLFCVQCPGACCFFSFSPWRFI